MKKMSKKLGCVVAFFAVPIGSVLLFAVGYAVLTQMDKGSTPAPGRSRESAMSSTKSEMRVDCVQLVQGVLKAPSTADFPHISLNSPGWRKHIDGDKEEILHVSSYVDSQNAFGAMIRTRWICGMNIRTRKVVFLQVGGKTLLDEIRRVEDLK